MTNKLTTVMTERNSGPSDDMIGHTRQNEPDVKIIVHPWYIMVVVRTTRVYLQTLLGLLTASATPILDFASFSQLFIAAAFPALVSFLQNTIEILSKLDTNERYSSYRA